MKFLNILNVGLIFSKSTKFIETSGLTSLRELGEVSRSYQELSNGVLGFEQSFKIALIPFPFIWHQVGGERGARNSSLNADIKQLLHRMRTRHLKWLVTF